MKTSSLPALIAAENLLSRPKIRNFTAQKDILHPKDVRNAELPEKPIPEADTAAEGTVKDNSLKLHVATADARQRFRLSPKEIDRFTALTATRICRIKAGSDG